MDKLTQTEIAEWLAGNNGWKQQDDKWIVKAYRFPTFPEAIAFVNEVATIAERLNHHPMIAIDYRVVTIRLTTWSAGGLTALDLDSAAQYDRV